MNKTLVGITKRIAYGYLGACTLTTPVNLSVYYSYMHQEHKTYLRPQRYLADVWMDCILATMVAVPVAPFVSFYYIKHGHVPWIHGTSTNT